MWSHRGAGRRHRPTARLIHLPVHAPWLNQVEIYFSIVQRKALTPNDFPDLAAVEQRLLAFQARYNLTAHPFGWRFTRADPDALLARITAHQTQYQDLPGAA